jgi:hypothetical protein
MMTLEGKKTYITAGGAALASFAMAMGWLSKEQYQVVLGLLASLGLAALRSGVARGAGDKAAAGEAAAAATGPDATGPAAGCGVGGQG